MDATRDTVPRGAGSKELRVSPSQEDNRAGRAEDEKQECGWSTRALSPAGEESNVDEVVRDDGRR
jgi:hypothetical protein